MLFLRLQFVSSINIFSKKVHVYGEGRRGTCAWFAQYACFPMTLSGRVSLTGMSDEKES